MLHTLRQSLSAPLARRGERVRSRRAAPAAVAGDGADRSPLHEPPCGRGHVDRVDDGFVSGWAAGPGGEPLEAPVTVWVDGRAVARFEGGTYRADLEAAGIAGGNAAFEVDAGEGIGPGAREIEVALSLGDEAAPRFFARQRVALPDHRALNPVPYPRLGDAGTLEGWEIDSAAELVLDEFSLSGPLLEHADGYVRLALIGADGADGTVRLRTALSRPRAGADGLTLGLMLRADRPTAVRCRVLVDGVAASELELGINSLWRLERHALPGIEALRAAPAGARIELELAAAHAGRGFLDAALCCASESVSFRYLRRAHAAPLHVERAAPRAPLARSYLDNGRFERWSRGTDFTALTGGDELADNWRFEGRASELPHVGVSVQGVSHAARGRPPGLGLRVRTGGFEGVMRLVGGLDASLLDEPAVLVRATLHAGGTDGFALVRRLLLLGRAGERETVLAVLARGVGVRGTRTVEARLDEAAMVRMRRGYADASALQLVVELERNADVLVESVSVEAAPREAVDEAGAPPATPSVGFEDPAIVDQLASIRGVESWLADGPCTDAALVERAATARRTRRTDAAGGDAAGGTGTIEGLEALRAATVRRPRPGYPTVDVVVPIHNALESVRECVRSVLERTDVPYVLTLVDDGSDAQTAAWLAAVAERFPNVALLVNEHNLGYTRTVNAGLRRCDADYVCVLNSDCVVTTGWLSRLIDCAVETGAAMVGPLGNAASYQSVPRIRDAGQWCFNPLPEATTADDVAALVAEHAERAHPRVRVINGFCQLISRAAIQTVGLLDEDAFPRGFGEENDFCARVVGAGLGIHVADDAYVFHAKSQSFGHEQRKALSRQGSQALRDKHPGVDWDEVTAELENQPAIARLRERLLENGL